MTEVEEIKNLELPMPLLGVKLNGSATSYPPIRPPKRAGLDGTHRIGLGLVIERSVVRSPVETRYCMSALDQAQRELRVGPACSRHANGLCRVATLIASGAPLAPREAKPRTE